MNEFIQTIIEKQYQQYVCMYVFMYVYMYTISLKAAVFPGHQLTGPSEEDVYMYV
jgi:hypothetical protein